MVDQLEGGIGRFRELRHLVKPPEHGQSVLAGCGPADGILTALAIDYCRGCLVSADRRDTP
jgi:hypothetical protein